MAYRTEQEDQDALALASMSKAIASTRSWATLFVIPLISVLFVLPIMLVIGVALTHGLSSVAPLLKAFPVAVVALLALVLSEQVVGRWWMRRFIDRKVRPAISAETYSRLTRGGDDPEQHLFNALDYPAWLQRTDALAAELDAAARRRHEFYARVSVWLGKPESEVASLAEEYHQLLQSEAKAWREMDSGPGES